MARLPTPAAIIDLRFTSTIGIAATIQWDGDDPFAELIRGLYIRFLLSNLEDLGAPDDAAISTFMESFEEHTDVGMPQPRIAPGPPGPPDPWAQDISLIMYHFDLAIPITEEEAKAGEYLLEWSAPVLAQHFVRVIVQARTAD